MDRRPSAATLLAGLLLVVAASGGAAGHAAVLLDARDLTVAAGDSVDVGLTFHNVDRVEFRLEGPVDGAGAGSVVVTASVRNTGDLSATLTLDTAAAGRGDVRAALRVAGGEVTGANADVERGGGPLPAGEYDMTLVTQGITVDRGSLVVGTAATATPPLTPASGTAAAGDGSAASTPAAPASTAAGSGTAEATPDPPTGAGGAGFGPGVALAAAGCALAAAALAARRRP